MKRFSSHFEMTPQNNICHSGSHIKEKQTLTLELYLTGSSSVSFFFFFFFFITQFRDGFENG